MLVQSKQLVGGSVVSLHTGQALGALAEIIINPHKLEILGFFVEHPKSREEPQVLLARDIRQVQGNRVFINSIDELTAASELVRFKDTLELHFNLLDKVVKTASKHRLGKVEEYAIDSLSWEIQKLYVKQSVLKNFTQHSLVIDRVQVVEVSDQQITVNDAVVNQRAGVPVQAPTPS